MDCRDETGDPREETLTEYERQRLHRIRENNAVLAALDLPALAASLRTPPASSKKSKHAAKRTPVQGTPRRSARLRSSTGERKVMRDLSSSSSDESDSGEQEPDLGADARKGDAEYEPTDEEEDGEEEEEDEGQSASDSELATSPRQSMPQLSAKKRKGKPGNGRNLDMDGKFWTARQLWMPGKISGDSRFAIKGNKRQSGTKRTSANAGLPSELPAPAHAFGQAAMGGDTEELELQRALAMSMGASLPEEGVSFPGSSELISVGKTSTQIPSRGNAQGAKSKRQLKSKRVELGLTEDDIVRCFFLMDESVTGNVMFRDLQRVAGAHDFTWTDEELLDMIDLFNSNSDGMLNLEEFRDIALRCNRR